MEATQRSRHIYILVRTLRERGFLLYSTQRCAFEYFFAEGVLFSSLVVGEAVF